jgi:malate permease and related proteins
MFEYVLNISPIILLALIGYVLKKIDFFNTSHADLFLKIVFYIAIPGLIFTSFDQLIFDLRLLSLPFFAAFILLLNFVISYGFSLKLKLLRKTHATFVLGASILNTGFLFPFILTVLGEEGISRLIMFDVGNVLLVITLLYYFACKMGTNDYSAKNILKKFSTSSPLIALVIALILNLTNIHLPDYLLELSRKTGNMVIPLVMFAMGIYFNPKLIHLKLSVITIFLRMVIGFIAGLTIVYIFNLQGLERTITIVGTSAPVGFNTLTFSSLENLDKELAASLLSFSIMIGVFSVPLLIYYVS